MVLVLSSTITYCPTQRRLFFLLPCDYRSEGDGLACVGAPQRNADDVGSMQVLSEYSARLSHPASFRVGVGVAVVVGNAQLVIGVPNTGDVPCFDSDSLPWCQRHVVIVTPHFRDVEHGLADEFKPEKFRDGLSGP